MTSVFGPVPHLCLICCVGGPAGARHCRLRDAVRTETGRDVACVVCGVEPGPTTALMTDDQDRWYCLAHLPEVIDDGDGE